jgi:hypothetical protein
MTRKDCHAGRRSSPGVAPDRLRTGLIRSTHFSTVRRIYAVARRLSEFSWPDLWLDRLIPEFAIFLLQFYINGHQALLRLGWASPQRVANVTEMLEPENAAPSPPVDRPAPTALATSRPVRFPRQDRLSRVADFVIAFAVIVFTLPLLAFVCLAIKLDSPGPVLYRQPRLGPDSRRFFVLRFRTMAHDPEQASRPLWGRGARETRVGHFLRYTRIEDLPQFVNVLRGDLRLIDAGVELPIFAD